MGGDSVSHQQIQRGLVPSFNCRDGRTAVPGGSLFSPHRTTTTELITRYLRDTDNHAGTRDQVGDRLEMSSARAYRMLTVQTADPRRAVGFCQSSVEIERYGLLYRCLLSLLAPLSSMLCRNAAIALCTRLGIWQVKEVSMERTTRRPQINRP